MIISKDLKANVRKSIIFNIGKTKYISGFFFKADDGHWGIYWDY